MFLMDYDSLNLSLGCSHFGELNIVILINEKRGRGGRVLRYIGVIWFVFYVL
jgi:hypothetical protein